MSNYLTPDFLHCALLTIDMQNDFALPGAIAEIQGTNALIDPMFELLKACRSRQIPIIHVIRFYKPDGSNVDLCRRALIESGVSIVQPGSRGADLVDALKPVSAIDIQFEQLLSGELQNIAPNEWVMYKSRWGAFYKTQLEEFLIKKNITTLIFTGCNFPNCPRTSIYEASERDFKTLLIKDAVSGIYEKGLQEMKGIGVTTLDWAELVDQLNKSGLFSL